MASQTMTDDRVRDFDRERAYTLEAASVASYLSDPIGVAQALNRFREERSISADWHRWSERDWIQESAEEIADLSAYLCAEMDRLEERVKDEGDNEDFGVLWMLLRIALASSCTAYGALLEYRQRDS
jgi:hypothetical protein